MRVRIPIKSTKEIERMRESGRIASEILQQLAAAVAPGVTTGEIDSLAADLMVKRDCRSAFLNYRGFSGQICISVNEEVVHGIGGPRRIQPGDIVKITAFCTVPGSVGAWRSIRAEVLGDHQPASTWLEVSGLAAPQWLFEVEAEAVQDA